jgi:hypothetical protein
MFGCLQMAFWSLWCWKWPLLGKDRHGRWNTDPPLQRGNIHTCLPRKLRMHPTAGKFMLAVFWDSQGLLLECHKERGSTVNGSLYSEMPSDKLKLAVWSKRWGLLSDGVVLLPNNAHPHTAAHTVETLKKLNFEVLEHLLCSPDHDLSDYHLFDPLQQALPQSSNWRKLCLSACLSAQRILFWGHEEDYVALKSDVPVKTLLLL